LLTKEALDVLALRPGATLTEIKEAYRDLVKVWHPDRFGSDPRLREKAEDKLKQINKAYLVLQSDRTGGKNASEPEDAVGSARDGGSWPRTSSSPPRTGGKAYGISLGSGWLYGCVGIALGLIVGYLAIQRGGMRGARPDAASVHQVEASSEQAASTIPANQTAGGELAGRGVSSAELPGRDVPPRGTGSSNSLNPAQFRVRSLSGTETDQLDSACSKWNELKDPVAYQACVKAQLDLITNARGRPDLSALSGTERESIESVCSEAKRRHGPDGYDRCLIAQIAKWAAEPARPDMSALNEADRSSIEAACRNAKYREGPAEYERCRAGLVELLAKSK
jgi:hypothetical protein